MGKVFAIVFSLATSWVAYAGVWPNPGEPTYPQVDLLIDKTRQLQIDSVRDHPDWFPAERPVIGFQDVNLWARLTIDNPRAEPKRIVIEDQWAMTDRIDFYLVHNDVVAESVASGHRVLASTAEVAYRFPHAYLTIPPGRSDIYVRYENDDNIGSRLALWTPATFRFTKQRNQLILGLLLGFVLVMGFYNFCIYLILRLTEYLYYSCYVLAFFFFQLCMQGLGFQFIAPHRWWADEGLITFAMLSIIFVILFTRYFLNLKVYFRASLIPGYLIAFISAGIAVMSYVPSLYQLSSMLAVAINLVLVAWIFVCSSYIVYQRRLQGYIFAVAWTMFLIGDTLTIMYYIGMLSPSFLTTWGMLVGSTIEVVLISFGLAYLVYEMRRNLLSAKLDEAKIKGNLETAAEIQTALVRHNLPHDLIEVASSLRTAEEACGDWYSIEMSPDGQRVYVFIGDVTGHGISSALITGSVSGAIKTSLTLVHRLDMAPAESLRTIAQEINHVVQVTGHDSGRLMTMLFCCLDLREQRLFYLNAGHLNFFHRHAGHWRPQLTAGSMLGMTQQPRWKVKECSLSVDDELVFFTDGLIENSNVAQQTLSVNAVLRTLQGLNSNSAEQTVQELMEQAHQLWQDVSLDDDVTVVCLRIKAFAAADRDTSWLQIVEPQSS